MKIEKNIKSVMLTLDQSFGALRIIQEKRSVSLAGIDLLRKILAPLKRVLYKYDYL